MGKVEEYSPGEVVFREGDAATFVLLVLTGKLEVFVERDGHNLVLTDTGPGAIVGELAVLCGAARSASVRANEASAVLKWSDGAFRKLILGNAFLAQRIFAEALSTLVEKERSLIEALLRSRAELNAHKS
jgi:CRP-like cAMP-binding protein